MLAIGIIGLVVGIVGPAAAWAAIARSARTRVAVEVTHGSTRAPIVMLDPYDTRPEPVYHVLRVAVINTGPAAEGVTFLAIEAGAGGVGTEGHDITDLLPDREQTEVGVRKRVTAEVATSDIDFDLSGGFTAVAHLASGKIIRSSRESLDHETLKAVAAHNKTARP